MTLRQPPRFAGRFLKRLVPAQDHNVLLGDLCEEYQRGRSVTWYCLQILAAIVVHSLKDVRANPLVAARAVVTGLLAQMFLISAFSPLQNILTGAGFMWGNRWWFGLPWYWHWPYDPSLGMVMQAIWIAGHVMVGWLIVRLHRGHGVTMVLVYCCVIGSLRSVGLLQVVRASGSPHLFTLLYRAANGQIREWLLMIAGGYLATRPAETA